MDRRTSIKLLVLGVPAFAAGCKWSRDDVDRARRQADAAGADGGIGQAQFFTEDEFETVRTLADLILPADERSGSASDLKVPEFIDFMAGDMEDLRKPIRDGLAWLDAHARSRFGSRFTSLTKEQQTSILDEIAYPDDAAPEVGAGVAFFSLMRDLTASGFWTTREGMDDLGYVGNVAVARFEGPPKAEIERLGLGFDEWEVV